MKLLFDVSATQPNSSGKRHGGGRYGEIILFRMIERKLKFACFYDSSKWLNPKVKTACQKGKIPLHDVCGSSVKQIVSEYGYTRLYSCLPQELAELTILKYMVLYMGYVNLKRHTILFFTIIIIL